VTCNDNSKRRGRPSTGLAMSGAERQRLRRERMRASGKETLTVDVDADVVERLRQFVEFKDMTLGEVVSRVLRDRLLRKR
jgi:hypothetical protein